MLRVTSFKIIGLVITAFLMSFFIFTPTTVSAACGINGGDAKFVNHYGDKDEGWYSAGTQTLNLSIETTGCAGEDLDIKLIEIDTIDNDVVAEVEITVPSNEQITVNITAGELSCGWVYGDSNDCELYIAVHLAGSSTVFHTSFPHPQGRLNYDCDDSCEDPWDVVSTVPAINVGSGNAEGTSCEIVSAKFMNYYGEKPDTWFSDEYGRLLHIQIMAPDCAGEIIYPSLAEVDNTPFIDILNDDVNELDDRAVRVPSNGKLDLYMWVGEAECEQTIGADCDYYLEIQTEVTEEGITTGPTFTSYDKPQGRLRYDCDGSCTNWWELASTVASDKTVTNDGAEMCNITNAFFSPTGTQGEGFFSDELQPLVNLSVQTENCSGHEVKVSVVHKAGTSLYPIRTAITDGFPDGAIIGPSGMIASVSTESLLYLDQTTSNINGVSIAVPNSENLSIVTKSGEDYCSYGEEYCIYYIQVINPANYTSTFIKEDSVINYKCAGPTEGEQASCAPATQWEIQSHNGSSEGGSPVVTTPTATTTLVEGDNCTTTVDGETTATEGCYELLAPIGATSSLQFGSGSTIGGYVNLFVGIMIGIATLLTVVMLVVGGVQYMTTDALAGKTNARETITKALLGLLLALGSFLILKTINPNLLNVEPGIQTVSYTADLAGWADTETTVDPSNPASLNYELAGTFQNPSPSNSQVTSFASALASSNSTLSEIIVQTSGPGSNNNGTATFRGTNGSEVTINVRFGANGVASENTQAAGDKKTPLGVYALNSDRRPTPDGIPVDGIAATSTTVTPAVNLGAAYYQINVAINGQNRGIGFHGRSNNTLGSTNGCIRMLNDDLLLLGPFMQSGTIVKII